MNYLYVLCSLMSCLFLVSPTNAWADQNTQTTNIKVVVTPFLNYAPFFIAQEEGFFTEQGLDVEFVRLTKAQGALPALINGDVDVISSIIYPGLFNAIAKGAAVRLVADRGFVGDKGCSWYSFVVRKQLAETHDLESGDWLKGARHALNSPSSPHAYLADRLMQLYGLSGDDLEHVSLPITSRIEAFESGSIDFTLTNEPWIARFVDSGTGVEWKPLAEVVAAYQQSGVQFGPRLLEQDAEAGKRFMVAYLKGLRQFNKGKTERNISILVQHTSMQPEILRRACWPVLQENGHIHIQSVLDYQDWAVEKGLVTTPVSGDAIWDPRFVDHANQFLASQQ